MLILTRRTKETIVIGDDIRVTVLGVNGNQVRIGIDAPKNINILREELLEGNQQRAAKVQIKQPLYIHRQV